MKSTALLTLALLSLVSPLAAEESRTWTDTKDQSIEGVYLSSDSDSVRIKRDSDQRAFDIPLSQLSEADRAYVAEQSAEEAESTGPSETVVKASYPASGEVIIEIPHHHQIDRFTPPEVVLVDEELDDPAEEFVLGEGSTKTRWDAGEHGMVGTITFDEVKVPSDEKGVVRFRFTGTWDGDPYDQIAYSRSVRLDIVKDGRLDLKEVEVDFERP